MRPVSTAGLARLGFGSLLALVPLQQPAVEPEAELPLRAEITRAEIEAHVRFLASDEMRGRFTGSAEARAAADYLAKILQREGVAPAGDAGTYLQAVPLARRKMTAAPEMKLADRAGQPIAAVYGVDFDFSSGLPSVSIADAHVVVARAASDVPAKVEPNTVLFLDAAGTKRNELLTQSGHPEGEGFVLLMQAGSAQPGKPRSVESAGSTPQRTVARPPSIRIRGPLLERLRAGEITSLSFASHVEEEKVEAFNVVGRIEGVNPEIRSASAPEAVVLSAHYDHLDGRGHAPAADAKEDRVYNGADDDASGCAAVLELAGAFAAGPKPARTLVFLFATGEEIGLLGTKEYIDHPVVPLERTVANLNFEMIGRPDPLVGGAGVLWLTGFERTNLGTALHDAGLAVKPDPRLDEHFFERSDNYAFVQRGVVGQTFSTYNLHEDYHTVHDEADRLDYAHMETCVQAGYAAARLVADGKIRPAWLEGKDPTRPPAPANKPR